MQLLRHNMNNNEKMEDFMPKIAEMEMGVQISRLSEIISNRNPYLS